ncbi:MAG: CoA transferase [Chloroflexota bacterium]|nr:CoA transferase [Chloroflexota bacterium]
MNSSALEGVRIADFSWAWAGPYAATILSLLGAEVIKVESMKRLDHVRLRALGFGHFRGVDHSPFFNDLNLNKKSITLDLTNPRAVEVAKRLVAISDVAMQNMRPGVIDRLGLGYEALREVKPDIVYLSSSACGATGPDREYIGYAPTFGALGGAVYLAGYPDCPPQQMMGSIDLRSAVTAAFAIIAALCHRQRTGQGQHIDLSSQETISILLGDAIMDYTMNGRVRQRRANRDDIMAPHNCYPCRDGKWVTIAVASDEEWQALCAAVGSPAWAGDERFGDAFGRHRHQEEIDRHLEEWTRERSPYEVMALLQGAGVAAFPSFDSRGLSQDPHLEARGIFTEMEHPVMGSRVVVAPHWKMSETPARIDRPAPLLGEHNGYVLGELLGMSAGEIAELEGEGAIY